MAVFLQPSGSTRAQEPEVSLQRQKEPKPNWSALLNIDQIFSAYTLAPDSRLLTYNPTYILSFTSVLGYRLPEHPWRFDARAIMDTEVTDSDVRTTENEIWFYDTRLRAFYDGIPSFAGFRVSPAFRVNLPTSRTSRSAKRYFSAGGQLSVSRAFDVLRGLSLTGVAIYDRWVAGSNVPTEGFEQQACPSNRPDCRGGFGTARDNVVAGMMINLSPLPRLSLNAMFFAFWSFTHPLGSITLGAKDGILGAPVELDSVRYTRFFTTFNVGASYAINGYLTAAVNMTTLASEFDTDGSRNNPIFNEETFFTLTFSVSADGLYMHVRGQEGEGSRNTNANAVASASPSTVHPLEAGPQSTGAI
ncbi:MAG: hypothetical protein AAF355_11260 [Myxococcota bacterium]